MRQSQTDSPIGAFKDHLLHALFHTVSDAVAAVEGGGRIATANPVFCALLGYEAGGLDGAAWSDVCADEADGADLRTLRTKDGRALQVVLRLVTSREGGFVAIVRASDASTAGDERIRTAFASARQGAYTMNVQTGEGEVSGYLCEFLGLEGSHAPLAHEAWREAIHPEDQHLSVNAYAALAAGERVEIDHTYRMRRADGEWRWMNNRGRVSARDAAGRPLTVSGVVADVTERRRAELRVEESERLLREAQRSAGEGAWAVDLRTGEGVISGLLCRLHGLKDDPAPLSIEAWRATIHPEDRRKSIESYAALLRGEGFDTEYRVRAPDGRWVWIHNRGQPVDYDHDGRPVRASGLVADISRRKELERKLTDSERFLRAALSSAQGGVWEIDLVTFETRFSADIATIFGAGNADVLISADEWSQRVHPDDTQMFLEAQKALLESKPVDFQYRVLSPQDEWRWVNSRGRVIAYDEAGAPLKAAGTATDITERKQLEDRLSEHERLLRQAVDGANEGVWRLQFETGEISLSGATARMFGFASGAGSIMLGEWRDRIHPEDRPKCLAGIERMAGGEKLSIEYRMRGLEGEWRLMQDRGAISERRPSGEPVAAAGVTSDLTEKRALEDRLESARRQLGEAVSAARLGFWRAEIGPGRLIVDGALAEIFGLSGPENIVEPDFWLSRIHPEDRRAVREAFESAAAGRTERMEAVCRLRDTVGEWRWVRTSGAILPQGADDASPIAAGVMEDITERRTLEQRLRESEARSVEALEAANLGTWRTDHRTGKVSVTGVLAVIFGVEEVTPEGWAANVHPDDLPDIRVQEAAVAVRTADCIDVTCRVKDRNGRWRWIETTGRVTETAADGAPLTSIGVARDITEQRILQDRLAESDRQLAQALAAADMAAWSYDLKAHMCTIRGDLAEYLGVDQAEPVISGPDWMQHVHPEDRGDVIRGTLAVAEGRAGTFEATYRAKARDGEWRWIRSTGRLIERDKDGAPAMAAGVLKDITERRTLELKLAESERLYREALESAEEEAWTLDIKSQALRFSARMLEKFGLGRDGAPVRLEHWVALVHPDDSGICEEARARLARGETIDTHYRVRDAQGGWRWMHNRGGVTRRDKTGAPSKAAGMIADITERKTLELQLETSEREFADAVRAARIGTWRFDLTTHTARVRGLLAELLDSEGQSEATVRERWRAAICAEDLPGVTAQLDAVRRGETDEFDATYRLTGPDGGWTWVRSTGQVIERNATSGALVMTGVVLDVTTQTLLDRALREEKERYEAICRITPVMMHSVDPSGCLVQVSDFWLRSMGYAREEVIGRHISDFVLAEDRERLRQVVLPQFWETGSCTDVPYRYVTKSGEHIEILLSAVVERDSEGASVRSYAVLVDVTERNALTRALREEKDRFEAIYRATPAMMHSIDEAGKILIVSDYWLSEMGYSREEVIGRQSIDFLDAESRTRAIEEVLPRLKETGFCRDVHYCFVKKDGEVIDVILNSFLERDADGAFKASHAVLADVTPLRRLEHTLREEKERFEKIYRATPALMHTVGEDGRIVQVSDYWLKVTGYSREEVIGRHTTEFVDDESRERGEREVMPRFFATGTLEAEPYRLVKKSGEKIDVLLSAILEYDPDGRPMQSYAVVTDVSDLRRAHEQLVRTNRELDRFATIASHDLQEPLRKIAAFSSLVQRRYADALDDEGRRCLGFMSEAAQRMQTLIDDLLAYSRVSSRALDAEPVDLAGVVADALDNIGGVMLESDAWACVGVMPIVHGDRVLLTQMLQNLLSNAVKYRSEKPPRIEIAARRDDDFWTVAVKDNGMGFDQRFAEKVFAPFQRLHGRDDYPGTGIGLAIVQQAAERHGGKVWVNSETGKGSTFFFTIPARIALASQTREADAA